MITLPMLPPITAFLFVPLFSWCDRDVGDGSEAGLSRSKAMALGIVGGGVLGALILGPWFGLCGLVWGVLRSLGFKGGTLDPSTPKTVAIDLVRYLLWAVGIGALALWQWRAPTVGAIAMLPAALGATGFRIWFGQITKRARAGGFTLSRDYEVTVERGCGALFGLGLTAVAFLHAQPPAFLT